jgi:hypothetical protein
MDHQSLSNVLGILRLIKAGNSHESTLELLQKWTGKRSNEALILKSASFVMEQIDNATVVINESNLVVEAKEGVLQTLQALKTTFSLSGIHSSPTQYLGSVSGAISNFVILLSASKIETDIKVPDEAVALAEEVEALITQFDDEDIDPVVRSIARRHLGALSTLLRHLPIFGLEAAMATYFEMIIRLRRAQTDTTQKSQKKMTALFQRMEEWKGRFETIDKIWNMGARWLGKAEETISPFLTYLP